MDIFDNQIFSSINDELDALSRSVQSPVNDGMSDSATVEKGGVLNPEKDKKENLDVTTSEVTGTPMEVPSELQRPAEPIIVNVNLEKTESSVQQTRPSPVNTNNYSATSNVTTNASTSQSINEVANSSSDKTVNQNSEVTSSAESINNSQNAINSKNENYSSQNVVNNETSQVSSDIRSLAKQFLTTINEFNKNNSTSSSDFSIDSTSSSDTVNDSTSLTSMLMNMNESQSSWLNQYLGLDKETKSTASTETSVTSENLNQTEVIKEPISFSEKIQPAPENKTNNSLPETSNQPTTGSESVALTLVNESKPEVAPSTQPMSQPQTPATNYSQSNIDVSLLESRLARIEYLLSNTLEVKIID